MPTLFFGRLRSGLAAAGFALILVGGFQPFYLQIFVRDRDATRAWLTELPYRRTPGLRSFLEEARLRTRRGDAIAFLTPYSEWEGGYRYALRGTRYILAGRRVLALVGPPGDGDLSHNMARADLLLGWQTEVPPGWDVVWSGPGGYLARRVR